MDDHRLSSAFIASSIPTSDVATTSTWKASGYVVLAGWRHDLSRSGPVKLPDPYEPVSIWLTMSVADERGVGLELVHESPRAPEEIAASVVISNPPTLSIRGAVIPELVGTSELSDLPWLGLELAFPSSVDIGEFGFGGPISR